MSKGETQSVFRLFVSFFEDVHQSIYQNLEIGSMSLLEMLFGKPIPEITPHELNEKLKDKRKFILVDVRQPEEFKNGHVPGAKLIPLGELSRRLDELPKDKEIACICASGSRSSSAARMLAKQGYNVVNVRGGMYLYSRTQFKGK